MGLSWGLPLKFSGADEVAVVEADAEEDEGKGGRDEGESER